MTKIHKKKRSSRFRYLVMGGIVVVVVAAASGWFYVRSRPSKYSTSNTLSTINYAPATPQEKAESSQHKEAIVNSQDHANNNSSQPTATPVTPIIVDASQYGDVIEVRGFVPQITESNGTCIYTFKGATTFTRQQAAVADATTTRCPAFDLPTTLFAPGIWSTTITYTSPAHTGTSDSRSFEVK